MTEYTLYPGDDILFNRTLEEYPGAIIAGGAVRDAVLMRPIKDLDVWVGLDDYVETPTMKNNTSGSEYDSGSYVNAVFDDTKPWSPYPINVIVVRSAQVDVDKLLNEFDYGLCKIAYSSKGLHLTEHFRCDAFHKVMSFGYPRGFTSPFRYEKLSMRYPDFYVEYPEEPAF